MYKQTTTRQNTLVYPLIGAVVSFIAIFILMDMLLTSVYGYNFENPQYTEIMRIAQESASNSTNNEIDQYVQSIKDDICLTLKPNQTAVNECFRL